MALAYFNEHLIKPNDNTRPDMHQFGYTSRAVVSLGKYELALLCEKSETYNSTMGITGLLVYDSVRFMQVIEGPDIVVRNLMADIVRDDRHDSITYIIDRPITHRAFQGWGLACIGFRGNFSSSLLLADVKSKVANVADMNVMAAFIGFAVLSKQH
jgi:hypothetical protein